MSRTPRDPSAGWWTGDVPTDDYHLLRYCVAGLAFAQACALVGAAHVARAQIATPPFWLQPASVSWWFSVVALAAGALALCSRRTARVGAVTVLIALSILRGAMTDGAAAIVASGAVWLCFVSWSRPMSAAWPLRLAQLALPVGYVSAVTLKLTSGNSWRAGSALEHISQQPLFWNRALPELEGALAGALTWGTLLFQGVLAVSLCVGLTGRRRWLVTGLVGSVGLHVCIVLSLHVGLMALAPVPMWAALLVPLTGGALPDRRVLTGAVVLSGAWVGLFASALPLFA